QLALPKEKQKPFLNQLQAALTEPLDGRTEEPELKGPEESKHLQSPSHEEKSTEEALSIVEFDEDDPSDPAVFLEILRAEKPETAQACLDNLLKVLDDPDTPESHKEFLVASYLCVRNEHYNTALDLLSI